MKIYQERRRRLFNACTKLIIQSMLCSSKQYHICCVHRFISKFKKPIHWRRSTRTLGGVPSLSRINSCYACLRKSSTTIYLFRSDQSVGNSLRSRQMRSSGRSRTFAELILSARASVSRSDHDASSSHYYFSCSHLTKNLDTSHFIIPFVHYIHY